jgi:hypothetical protein
VHNREHLVIVRPGILVDAVEAQRLRRAAAALVERGDESGFCSDFLELLFEAHCTVPIDGLNWGERELYSKQAKSEQPQMRPTIDGVSVNHEISQ